MAVVRRVSNDWRSGYGVKGQIYQQPLQILDINLKELSADIEPPKLPNSQTGALENADVWYTRVLWRAKMSAIAIELNKTDTFHNPSLQRKLGRYVFKAEGYVTHAEFYSHADTMSALGSFTYASGDPPNPEDEPCDEPPITLGGNPIVQPSTIANAEFSSYTGNILSSVGANIPISASTTPGDMFSFYPESCLQSFIVGITFVFFQVPLTQQQWIALGLPPVTIF